MSTSSAPIRRSALDEPVDYVRGRFLGVLSAGMFGIWFASQAGSLVLLALHVSSLVGDGKEVTLSLVLAAGSVFALVVNPVVGALSDRTTARFGRRRPWVAAGGAVAIAGLLVLAAADSVPVLVLGWCLVSIGINAMIAALTASVPDQVPDQQRGLVSGVMAVALTLGTFLASAVAAATGSFRVSYIVCAAGLAVFVTPFLLSSREIRLLAGERAPTSWRTLLASFWISPRRHPDFAWAWGTRFLINLGNGIGVAYLPYYLIDAVGLAESSATALMPLLVLCYTIGVVLTTIIAGRMSDRTGRRKVFVIAAAGGIGLALLVFSLQTLPAAFAAAMLLGLSYGVYTSVDFALMTEVLPEAADRAKDLGVIAIALTLPAMLAPVIAAPLATGPGGYFTLYLVGAMFALVGGALITQIKGVQ